MCRHKAGVSIMHGICFIAGMVVSWKLFGPKADQWYKQREEYREKSHLLQMWMEKREQGKRVSDYLAMHHYTSVAVYGMGEIGEHLLYELLKDRADIRYVIDRQKKTEKYDIPVCSLKQKLQPVDLIIVTPMQFYDEIRRDIEAKVNCPIVSIEEVVYAL